MVALDTRDRIGGMTKTQGPGNRKQKIVWVVEDVQPFEALDFDPRLPDPQIVFAGMVPLNMSGLSLPGVQPQGVRPVWHAVFLIPTHLVNDPKVQDIKRGRPQVAEVEPLEDRDLAS